MQRPLWSIFNMFGFASHSNSVTLSVYCEKWSFLEHISNTWISHKVLHTTQRLSIHRTKNHRKYILQGEMSGLNGGWRISRRLLYNITSYMWLSVAIRHSIVALLIKLLRQLCLDLQEASSYKTQLNQAFVFSNIEIWPQCTSRVTLFKTPIFKISMFIIPAKWYFHPCLGLQQVTC